MRPSDPLSSLRGQDDLRSALEVEGELRRPGRVGEDRAEQIDTREDDDDDAQPRERAPGLADWSGPGQPRLLFGLLRRPARLLRVEPLAELRLIEGDVVDDLGLALERGLLGLGAGLGLLDRTRSVGVDDLRQGLAVHRDRDAGGDLELGFLGELVHRLERAEHAEVGHDVGARHHEVRELRLLRLALAAVAEHEEHEDGQDDDHAYGQRIDGHRSDLPKCGCGIHCRRRPDRATKTIVHPRTGQDSAPAARSAACPLS